MDERSDFDSSDTQRRLSDVPANCASEKTEQGVKRTSVVTLDKCSGVHTSTTTVDIISDLQENETILCNENETLRKVSICVPDLVVK